MIQFIKIGTDCIIDENNELNYGLMRQRAREIEQSKDKTVLVVSGAVRLGKMLLGERRSNNELKAYELASYASVGQLMLMRFYADCFEKNVAQILATYKDLENRNHLRSFIHENLKNDLITLLNYNDPIDSEEVRKDNDIFAATIAGYAGAKRLVIVGKTYEGFEYKGNIAQRLTEITQDHFEACKAKSTNGTGGFEAKLRAAQIMLANDAETIIGNVKYSIDDLVSGRVIRTLIKR